MNSAKSCVKQAMNLEMEELRTKIKKFDGLVTEKNTLMKNKEKIEI